MTTLPLRHCEERSDVAICPFPWERWHAENRDGEGKP